MSTRNERIDQLVDLARNVLRNNHTYGQWQTLEDCDAFMIKTWGLSSSSRSDYRKAVEVILKEEFNARHNQLEEMRRKEDEEIRKGNLHNIVSRERLFYEVFKKLASENDDEVEEKTFLAELQKTGRFSASEAATQFTKAKREGQIYERRPGMWAKA